MNFAEELKQKKLKHVKEEDIKITKLPTETEDETKSKKQMVESDALVDIEKWYGLLGEDTFPTEFVPVTKIQASKFVQYFQTRENPMLPEDTRRSSLAMIKKELAPLEALLQDKINEFGGEVFVKTSSRSPKDAVELGGRLRNNFDALHDLPFPDFIPSTDPEDDNELRLRLHKATNVARRVMQASYISFKVTNASDGIDLLLNSQRICEDFQERINYATNFHENIVVRKWVNFDWQMELRAFVYGNKLNGLSQYTHFIYIPRMHTAKDQIQAQVQKFWDENCKDKLSHFENYIIDFVIGEDNKIMIIELNPFDSLTNGTLYRWVEDREELHNGPLKFRVRGDYYQRGLQLFIERYPSYFEGIAI